MADELVLNLGHGMDRAFVNRQSDPIAPSAGTPADFAAQFPQPLDTTELIAMCEEISLYRAIPELPTALKSETWRELSTLAFTSGSSYVSFADGTCPEEFYSAGANQTIDLKNIGAHKSLTISDILHSAAVSSLSVGEFGVGIHRLVGGFEFGEGMPGGNSQGVFTAEVVSDLKAKEMALAGVLTLNGWDRLLATGDAVGNPLEFSGLETLINSGTGAHYQNTTGTFDASKFDRFLSEGCAKPDTLVGNPQAIQELMSAYFVLGFQGSQIIMKQDGERLVPGFNFAGEVNTGIGPLKVIADKNIGKTTVVANSNFSSAIYALRMNHNGEPLVYKRTQIPFSFKDLLPGCTSISFQVWAKTALIVKALCAQGRYFAWFSGRSVTTCSSIG